MKSAVLGFGYWAPNVVRALIGISSREEVVIVEPVPGRRHAAETQFPGVRTLSTIDAILNDPSIEAVLICTPARTHFEIAAQVLRSGKSAFIEKPFTTSVADAEKLFQLASERSLIVYPGHVFLHSAYFLTLQGILGRRELGELRYAVGRRASLGPRAREDINVTWDYLIHDVYVFNALLQGPPIRVTGQGAAYLRPGTEDVCFAVLEYPRRLLIHLYSSWYAPEKVRTLLLVGSKAMVDYDELRADSWRLFARGYQSQEGTDQYGNVGLNLFDRGASGISPPSTEEPLRREIRTFLTHVERREPPPGIEQHVLQVTRTMEAINASIAAGGRPTAVADSPSSIASGRAHETSQPSLIPL